jgi:glucokinase
MTNVIAVDLGGTNIRAARVDNSGKIQMRDKVPTNAKEIGMSGVVKTIAAMVSKLRDDQTVCVGIGTPGAPDHQTGVMTLPAVNIPGSANFPLTAELSKLTGLPVAADNDGNLAALGESWLGAGKGEPVVAIFTLGTGIGGGLVVDGNVYHGYKNVCTEVGHVSIDWQGRKCGCGGNGCIELYASASALGRDSREALRTHPDAAGSLLMKLCGGPENIDKCEARLTWEAAGKGDKLACFLVDRCCDWLSTGIGSLINVFNPSCVIIGGGMSLAGEALLSRLRTRLDAGRAFGPIWKMATLKQAELGDDAGILGAARMALNKQITN